MNFRFLSFRRGNSLFQGWRFSRCIGNHRLYLNTIIISHRYTVIPVISGFLGKTMFLVIAIILLMTVYFQGLPIYFRLCSHGDFFPLVHGILSNKTMIVCIIIICFRRFTPWVPIG